MKFYLIKKSLNSNSLKKIILILKAENKSSILANLSNANIKEYLDIVVKQSNMELYVVSNPAIIGYAILARKPKYLIQNFQKLKILVLFDLLIKLKFVTLINIFISIINFDMLFVKDKNKELIKNSLNLNLLGIQEKHQGKGIGTNFLKFILKKTKHRSKYITCEADNSRSTKFYKKNLNFKLIGLKIRIPGSINILSKKI